MRHPFHGILILYMTACMGSACGQSGSNTLVFTICQERDVYERSDYGEPPQFAIWLESKQTGEIRTVFVTYRTAKGDFEGKMECPVSLPAWIGAFREETGREDIPSFRNPAAEAITGATPKVREFSTRVSVPEGSHWHYYVEVNVSGDYTPEFPSIKSAGINTYIDSQGNGQPSIVYRGEITGTPGDRSKPRLIGRTRQFYLSTEIITDLSGIGNAKDVFSMIEVRCLE